MSKLTVPPHPTQAEENAARMEAGVDGREAIPGGSANAERDNITPAEAYAARAEHDAMQASDHQLHACRYYVHMLRCKTYSDAVARGELTVEEARPYYELAMINFDQLMVASKSGAVTLADQVSMDKGFPL